MTDETKEIILAGATFVLHKIPPFQGRAIMILYAPGEDGIVKAGASQEGLLKMMNYVSVKTGEGKNEIALSTEALINNHLPDTQTLLKLEAEMLDFNFSS